MLAESAGLDPDYQLPEIGEIDYLVNILSALGEGKLSGERLAPIDWIDIKAWMDVTGEYVTSGEAEAIRRLSGAYVSQYYDAMKPECPPPNIERPKSNEVIAGKIKGLFAMLRN